jgi:peroxiredoxin
MSLIAIQSRRMAASLTLRRAFAALPNPSGDQSKFYDVPEGHSDSDLSQTACNIGLNRRRDLTIGACGKIKLTIDGNETTLAELLAGKLGQPKLTALFGVPDRGSVCTSKHVPSYLKQLDALRKQGVDQIICVSRGEPAAVAAWGAEAAKGSKDIAFAADVNGGLTRMLGMDLEGDKCLRYAVALEDGVTLKVLVEKQLGDMKETSGESMVKFLKSRPGAH